MAAPHEHAPTTADETLLTAMACGASVEAAAQKAGVSRATAFRRVRSPVFRRRLKSLRREMVEKTAALLTAAGGEAVKTLLLLLGGTHASATRLGAARAILELGCRLRDHEDFDERLAAVESRIVAGDHAFT